MSENKFPELVSKITRNSREKFHEFHSEGKQLIGYTCTYVPEELIYAAGYIPVRLLGRTGSTLSSDRYMQTFCCSQVRSLLEEFLGGAHSNLRAIVTAHSCDSMQAFHDILKITSPDVKVLNFNFPSRLSGEPATRYLMKELERFKNNLEALGGGKVTENKISESIEIYNKNRELLDRLYSLHLTLPEKILGVMLHHAVCASMFMDKREMNPLFEEYVNSFEGKQENSMRRRLFLIGSINTSEEPYIIAHECGAMIADDDFCTGRRYFSGIIDEMNLSGISKRYLDKALCASKHRQVASRIEYICESVKKNKIDGVIFLLLKFCDPQFFDYPDIKKKLDLMEIPSLLIEIESGFRASGQLRTKIQAFLEMLN